MATVRGLTAEGLEALDARLGGYVEQGYVPGLVALVACGPDVHATAIGHKAFADPDRSARTRSSGSRRSPSRSSVPPPRFCWRTGR
jgi:hypothetical protein